MNLSASILEGKPFVNDMTEMSGWAVPRWRHTIKDARNLGGHMNRVNCFPIFLLGYNLERFLDRMNAPTDYVFADLARDAAPAIQSLDDWGMPENPISAPHSKKAASTAMLALQALVSTEYLQEHGAEVVPSAVKEDINFKTNHFVGLLASELAEGDVYAIAQKRLYHTKGLIFAAEFALPGSIVMELPEQCRRDIQEAGKCLVFDLPTACGFHIFRALEAIVLLYFPLLRLPAPKPSQRNLGQYIDALSKNGVKEELTSMLEYLRKFYRNPLMHPELTLEDEEAVGLFGYATDAMGQLMKDIICRRRAVQATDEGENREEP